MPLLLRKVGNLLRTGNCWGYYVCAMFSGPSRPQIPVLRLSESKPCFDNFKPIPGGSPCRAGVVIWDLPALETLHLVADKISRYKMF